MTTHYEKQKHVFFYRQILFSREFSSRYETARLPVPIAMNYKGPGPHCNELQGPWHPLSPNTRALAPIASEYNGSGPHCHGIPGLRSPLATLPRNTKLQLPLPRNTKAPVPITTEYKDSGTPLPRNTTAPAPIATEYKGSGPH